MTIAEQIMQETFNRLIAVTPAPLVDDVTQIKRFHLTTTTREDGDVIHLRDGRDAPDHEYGKNDACESARTLEFQVVIFIRGDAGITAVDPIKAEVYKRLAAPGYPATVRISQPVIEPESEVSDKDATKLTMNYKARYVARNGEL